MLPAITPIRTKRSPSCQYIRGRHRGPFHSSNVRHARRRGAMHFFTVENSVMDGGSLTPQKPNRPNRRVSRMNFDSALNKAPEKFICNLGNKKDLRPYALEILLQKN